LASSAQVPARLSSTGAVAGAAAPRLADARLHTRSSAMLDGLRERRSPLGAAAREARDAHKVNRQGAHGVWTDNPKSTPRRALATAIAAAENAHGSSTSAVLCRVGISGGATRKRCETSVGGVGCNAGGVAQRPPLAHREGRAGQRQVADPRSGGGVAQSSKAAASGVAPGGRAALVGGGRVATPSAAGTSMRKGKDGLLQPPQTPPTAPPSAMHLKRASTKSREGESASISKENRESSGGQLVCASCSMACGPKCGGARAGVVRGGAACGGDGQARRLA
jgi:hypothetical protein